MSPALGLYRRFNMLIRKEQREGKQIEKDSIVWEYKLGNKDLGFALARINGRYPESGWTMNRACQLLYYVVSGRGNCS